MEHSPSPTISVLVPSFNEEPGTIQASFQTLRSQTWADFECLVIDESTDPVKAEAIKAECALDSRFRYIRPESRIGLAASLNLGLSVAKGALIARFDSDDLCTPRRLELQANFLASHPEMGVVGGAMEIIDDSGATAGFRSYPLDHGKIFSSMMWTNAMAHPTVMFRRTLIESFGGYDPQFRFSEDLELWLKWLNAGVRFANLPDVLLKYRQQETRRHVNNWKFNLKARRRHFCHRLLVRRVLGIAAIACWSITPAHLQESLFRALMFHPRKKQGL